MSIKIFNVYAWSSIMILICLFEHIQISNAGKNCLYKNDDQLGLAMIWCPNVCCPGGASSENTTCCNPPVVYATSSILFGYHWWTISLSAICFSIAICLLVRYTKRIHILNNFKHFNSVVDPTSTFTISKSQLNLNLNNDDIVLEKCPPSYTSSVSPPPPPPPYAFLNP